MLCRSSGVVICVQQRRKSAWQAAPRSLRMLASSLRVLPRKLAGCLRAFESDTTMASYGKHCGWNVSECGWNACEQSSLRVICICLPAAHLPSLILPAAHLPSLILLWQALRVELRVVSMRQHTSAYVSIRQHTSANVSTRALRVELRVECLPAAQGVRAHGKQGRRVARLSRRSGGF